nr:MAG TPA: hypothetical protein [Caudoviricetes sp.]
MLWMSVTTLSLQRSCLRLLVWSVLMSTTFS